ncbi:zinc peroxisomal-like [Nannochloropsis oceanica]
MRVTEGIPSLLFIVQSNVADPETLADRMLLFIESCGKILEGLRQGEFESFVAGLVGKKLEREKRLEQQAGRHWEEISLGEYKYDRPQKEAALLRQLTKQNVVSFYRSFLLSQGPSRRLLTTQVYPQKMMEGGRGGGKEEVKIDGTRVEGVVGDELALRASLSKY